MFLWFLLSVGWLALLGPDFGSWGNDDDDDAIKDDEEGWDDEEVCLSSFFFSFFFSYSCIMHYALCGAKNVRVTDVTCHVSLTKPYLSGNKLSMHLPLVITNYQCSFPNKLSMQFPLFGKIWSDFVRFVTKPYFR